MATDALQAWADGTETLGDPSIPSLTGVVPGSGEVKHYQFWYRDPTGPCGAGFNLSNGLSIHLIFVVCYLKFISC